MVNARQRGRRYLAAAAFGTTVLTLASCGQAEKSETVQASSGVAASAQETPSPPNCIVSSTYRSDHPVPTGDEQESKRRVIADVLTPAFGSPAKDGGQLNKGFIGLAIDRAAETYIAVVDQTRVDVARLDAQLGAAGSAAKPPVKFRAQPACFTSAELQEAAEVLRAGEWHPRAKAEATRWSLTPEDSTYHVEVGDPAVADALVQRLGNRVTISND
ncbi:MAG: hypothetical protein ACT4QF_13290 [Sporichthyaceae bacterium]